ncbi:uncharacterized protein LOC124691222 [Lolium rigidum]|uniref:uncharacterized protein LOC124691222 n=1 Tax=Lolium rigidum TaxID=89674 RepID=UPI001F5C6605|nr:uncharacterized protein LOC124691222 [Lolium rigidum]
MGDYKIQISTELINQLARDDEKVKRKVRKPKPKKAVEQRDEPQDNGRELPSEPKISPTAAPGWQLPPPMYLPVTPAPPPPLSPAIQEVEAIRTIVAESEKVLEKLDKQGGRMQQELTRRANELHDREFKLPYQNPAPCADEKADCRECYVSNAAQDPLKCAEAVRRFEACVRMARHSGGVQAGQ